ncbi:MULTISPECIES: MDR family MFS transporter [unclassified Sporosarcina]|uniref:MDR family MFS transporter n=1 Tax=unclassified Sporosarcina TaxID=2647733 RepID=UPI00203F96AF|nr:MULTISPECIES: MDR family MFS transporter [unclassified Sporosarcina]GKV66493.1 multidrug resistance protein 3 [Sporosarcina sp. NCCP-2331]GLB56770.1 multidrug resistance protein 3 [Sporosarcina sp. NCCP-2378]
MEVSKSNEKLVLIGLLLAMFMAAIDNTIVATAMGTIVSDLGGLDKFAWVTSAYIVATMAGMPLFGKMSDMYGRKKLFIFGVAMFLGGSMLCGLAGSIEQLSIFRAIQGIGGGALMPIAFTIVYDIFPADKRGKMLGLLGAVFGIAGVFGPLLGAFITDYLGWEWVFYINVPIGIVVLALILKNYKESLSRMKQKIDWAGAITLVIAVVSMMFVLELGGKQYAWDSTMIISLIVSFAVFFTAFVFVEIKAEEPIVPFFLFKRRLFASAQILAFLYGATYIILIVYLPIFIQAVYGVSALGAGLVLLPLMLGTVAGSASGGVFLTKTTFRTLMTISIISYFSGMLLLGLIDPDTTRTMLSVYMVLVGFGMGFSFTLLPTASLHKLEYQYRGTANSTNSFMRTLGMTIGIAVFGSLQSNLLTDKLAEGFKGLGADALAAFPATDDIRQIFEPAVRAIIPTEVLNTIVIAMSHSVSFIYLLALIPIGLAAFFVYLMGNARETGEDLEETE